MTVRKHEREHSQLGLDRDITRRDFLGSTLIGSGAALLAATAPGLVASGQCANHGRSAHRAGAGLDRAGRRWRLRPVERQHSRGRQCVACGPQRRLRVAAAGSFRHRRDLRPGHRRRGICRLSLGVSLAQGAPERERTALRCPPDLRWRGKAERVRSRRRAAVGTAGFERQRLPDQEGARNGLRCAVVARAGTAGGIRLAGTEGTREGTAHSARRVRADAHHLGIGRPGLLLRGQGLRRQSMGEPLQGCADPGAAQAGHDLDGDFPSAPAPRGLGEVARRDDLPAVHHRRDGHQVRRRELSQSADGGDGVRSRHRRRIGLFRVPFPAAGRQCVRPLSRCRRRERPGLARELAGRQYGPAPLHRQEHHPGRLPRRDGLERGAVRARAVAEPRSRERARADAACPRWSSTSATTARRSRRSRWSSPTSRTGASSA